MLYVVRQKRPYGALLSFGVETARRLARLEVFVDIL